MTTPMGEGGQAEDTDRTLVTRGQAGEDAALEELVRRHQRPAQRQTGPP